MVKRHRTLTLQEHERIGELLFQAQEALLEAYKLAAVGYTVQELEPLERLWRTAGTLDKVKSRLDSALFRDAPLRDDPPGTTLARVYFAVERRVQACAPAATERPTVRRTLDEVMAAYPTLTWIGFGIGQSGPDSASRATAAGRAHLLEDHRAHLRDRAAQIARACDWIEEHLAKTRRVSRAMGSYGLKHLIEAHIDYLSNGECIAAMAMCGYQVQPEAPPSPNALFNLSARALRAAPRVPRGTEAP